MKLARSNSLIRYLLSFGVKDSKSKKEYTGWHSKLFENI